jgi:hypothetical protein
MSSAPDVVQTISTILDKQSPLFFAQFQVHFQAVTPRWRCQEGGPRPREMLVGSSQETFEREDFDFVRLGAALFGAAFLGASPFGAGGARRFSMYARDCTRQGASSPGS